MRTSKVLRCSAAALVVATIAVASSFLGAALAGGPQTFSDVNASHPFYGEIEWLAASGITTGYPDGTFRPGAPVTRQAMAAYLQRSFSGIVVETDATNNPASATFWDHEVLCPQDTRPIAGGGRVDTSNVFLTDSAPNNQGTGWNVRFESEDNVGKTNVVVTAHVTCVPETP
jgi:hypothetical protein